MSKEVPGIVVLTHGTTGKELIASLEMIVGTTENISAVPLLPGQSPESYLNEIRHVLDEQVFDTILLVDLFGGTPSNCAAKLCFEYSVDVVSGVNLPMLVEALQIRGTVTGQKLRQRLVEAGRDGIRDIVFELNQSGV